MICDDLPKTRSGKIMRRLLRDIATGEHLGDVTTLRDPDVVKDVQKRFADAGGLGRAPARLDRGPARAEAERTLEFWRLIGFDQVEAPEVLGDAILWVEREGTQVHLILTEGHTAPVLGHAAVVVPDHAEAKDRLREAGFQGRGRPAALGSGPRLRDRPRRPPGRADGRAAAHARRSGGAAVNS